MAAMLLLGFWSSALMLGWTCRGLHSDWQLFPLITKRSLSVFPEWWAATAASLRSLLMFLLHKLLSERCSHSYQWYSTAPSTHLLNSYRNTRGDIWLVTQRLCIWTFHTDWSAGLCVLLLSQHHDSNSPSSQAPGTRSPPSAGIFWSAVPVSPVRRTDHSSAGPASHPWYRVWWSDESHPPASGTGLSVTTEAVSLSRFVWLLVKCWTFTELVGISAWVLFKKNLPRVRIQWYEDTPAVQHLHQQSHLDAPGWTRITCWSFHSSHRGSNIQWFSLCGQLQILTERLTVSCYSKMSVSVLVFGAGGPSVHWVRSSQVSVCWSETSLLTRR